MKEIRCHCGKLLGKINGEYEVKCPRCKAINTNNFIIQNDSVIQKVEIEDSIIYKGIEQNIKTILNTK